MGTVLRSFIYFTLVSLVFANQFAHAVPQSLKEVVDSLVAKPDGFRGAAGVVVSGKNNQKFFYSAGIDQVSMNSIVEIGSNTKVFTGLLLGLAVVEGKLSLQSSVNSVLGQVLPTEIDQQLQVVHLSTQSSGLPRMPTNFNPADPANPYADYSGQNLFDYLDGLSFRELSTSECTPDGLDISSNFVRRAGNCYVYSNVGVGVLGQLLARTYTTDYAPLLKSRIFSKFAMNHTDVEVNPAYIDKVVQGYNWDGEPAPLMDFDVMAPTGALKSTPGDMAQFIYQLLTVSDTNIGKASKLARRVHSTASGQNMGLGWHIESFDGKTIHWHNGGTFGFLSFIGIDFERRIGVFIVGNELKISGGTIDDRIDQAGFKLLSEFN